MAVAWNSVAEKTRYFPWSCSLAVLFAGVWAPILCGAKTACSLALSLGQIRAVYESTLDPKVTQFVPLSSTFGMGGVLAGRLVRALSVGVPVIVDYFAEFVPLCR